MRQNKLFDNLLGKWTSRIWFCFLILKSCLQPHTLHFWRVRWTFYLKHHQKTLYRSMWPNQSYSGPQKYFNQLWYCPQLLWLVKISGTLAPIGAINHRQDFYSRNRRLVLAKLWSKFAHPWEWYVCHDHLCQ